MELISNILKLKLLDKDKKLITNLVMPVNKITAKIGKKESYILMN